MKDQTIPDDLDEIPDMEDEGAGLEDEDDAAVRIVHPDQYVQASSLLHSSEASGLRNIPVRPADGAGKTSRRLSDKTCCKSGRMIASSATTSIIRLLGSGYSDMTR